MPDAYCFGERSTLEICAICKSFFFLSFLFSFFFFFVFVSGEPIEIEEKVILGKICVLLLRFLGQNPISV